MASAPQLEPGQDATLILSLNSNVKVGRNLHFQLTTDNGFVITNSIRTGEQKLI